MNTPRFHTAGVALGGTRRLVCWMLGYVKPRLVFRVLAVLISILLCCSASKSTGTDIVNDPFDDGDVIDGADPLDIPWVVHSFGTASVVSDNGSPGIGSGNALSHNPFAGNLPLVGSFTMTPADSGQVLRLSFDFRVLGDPPSATSGFRFGLANSNGTPVTPPTNSGEVVNDYSYLVSIATGTATPTFSISKESGVSPNSATLGNGADIANVTSSGTTYTIPDNKAYSVVFEVVRSSSSSVSLNAYLYSQPGSSGTLLAEAHGSDDGSVLIDGLSAPIFTSFDEIFVTRDRSIPDQSPQYAYILDNVRLQSVPEPHALALLTLAGLLPWRVRRCTGTALGWGSEREMG